MDLLKWFGCCIRRDGLYRYVWTGLTMGLNLSWRWAWTTGRWDFGRRILRFLYHVSALFDGWVGDVSEYTLCCTAPTPTTPSECSDSQGPYEVENYLTFNICRVYISLA